MKNYVDVSLTPGEQTLYRGKLSLWSFFTQYIVGGFLLFIGLVSVSGGGSAISLIIGAAIFVCVAIDYISSEATITNKRVVSKSGLIRRNLVELDLKKIEGIQLRQGLRGRIFNYGTIVFTGAGNPEIYINSIKNPLLFREEFITAQENNRSHNYQ